MKRFYCQCGHEIFFQDLYCMKCGRDVGYAPEVQTMWSGEISQESGFKAKLNDQEVFFKLCENRYSAVECNWLVADDDANCQCLSCRTTRTIPDLSMPKNPKRWRELELAKRQLFNSLLDMNLMICKEPSGGCLQFDFLEDKRSNPSVTLEHVLTGHHNGLITLNAAEADEGFIHTMKEQMQERYRTLLGHFRHEIGHYFWTKLVRLDKDFKRFREVFGDERADYAEALQMYYDSGARNYWRSKFITPYASSHPHEDWAETWAHYMHIVDTLETAKSYGISVYEPKENDFNDWFAEWERVAQIMNALNRSMGLADPYPFTVSVIVEGKLRLIDELIEAYNVQITY